MAAPKGNQFWKVRTKHGRDRVITSPEALWEACCEYFEWIDKNPLWETKAFAFQGFVTKETLPKMRAMTLSGLCFFLRIDETTWQRWRREGPEEFRCVVREVDGIIRDQKFAGAAAELLNPNIIARDLGLADKSALDHRSGDGSMSPKAAIDASKLSTSALREILAAATPDATD